MADTPKKHPSYLAEVARFYFAPDLRSIGTLIYLGVFGYACLYYLDNILLAIRFLFYILFGHTALVGPTYLFTGMSFAISLVLPFGLSFYSIFVLHRVWAKPTWAMHIKWFLTCLILICGLAIVTGSDKVSRIAAKQPSMQSFIEDTGLSGRI